LEDFFENEAVERFEQMLENNESVFFDVEECSDIISYYLEIGDYKSGEIALNYALNLYSDSLEIKIRKLELLLEKGDNLVAKTLIDELESLADDDNLDYIMCTAKYYSNVGNSKKAIELCKKALAIEEDEDFIHNFIADEYMLLEDYLSALKHYKASLIYDPEDDFLLSRILDCYYNLNKKEEAENFIEDYLDHYPFSENAWYHYGTFNFKNKDYEKAIKCLDFALAINHKSISTYTQKADCYICLKNWKKAIESYQESQKYESTKAYSFHQIGLCYQKMGQKYLALEALYNSIYEDPQYYESMKVISEIYEEMGNIQEAAKWAIKASVYNENDIDLQQKLVFLHLSLGRLDIAVTCLKKVVEINPDKFHNWYAYAEVLMLMGKYEEAEKKLLTAIETHHKAELYYQLSNCYFNLDMKEHAKKALNNALELDPTMFNDMQQKYPSISQK